MNLAIPAFLMLMVLPTFVNASTFDAICGTNECRVDLTPSGISIGDLTIPNEQVSIWIASGAENPSQLLNVSNVIRGAAVGLLIAPVVLGPVGLIWGGLAESGGGDVKPDLHFKIAGCSNTGIATEVNLRFLSSSTARRFRMELPMFTNLTSGQQRLLSPCTIPKQI